MECPWYEQLHTMLGSLLIRYNISSAQSKSKKMNKQKSAKSRPALKLDTRVEPLV